MLQTYIALDSIRTCQTQEVMEGKSQESPSSIECSDRHGFVHPRAAQIKIEDSLIGQEEYLNRNLPRTTISPPDDSSSSSSPSSIYCLSPLHPQPQTTMLEQPSVTSHLVSTVPSSMARLNLNGTQSIASPQEQGAASPQKRDGNCPEQVTVKKSKGVVRPYKAISPCRALNFRHTASSIFMLYWVFLNVSLLIVAASLTESVFKEAQEFCTLLQR